MHSPLSSELLRDVQLTSSKKRSSTSEILSCSSASLQVCEPESKKNNNNNRVNQSADVSSTRQLPYAVLTWHFIMRGTIAIFILLNNLRQYALTLILLAGILLSILHMLLLHVLKARRLNYLACVLNVFASLESVALLFYSDHLLHLASSLGGIWTLLFLTHVRFSCSRSSCRCRCCRKPSHDTFDDHIARDFEPNEQYVVHHQQQPQRKSRNSQLCHTIYVRIVWYVLLSMLNEFGNILYFWYLMQAFEQEIDAEKKHVFLFCINVKLLLTTYSRNMILNRPFSICSLITEFCLFCITSAVVYCYLFLQLNPETYLLLHYSFWVALALEIISNLISFLFFSIKSMNQA